ncbi:MAG: multicopper oxidase domain-containing protein [Acetobacteraceae bacterium]
MIARFTRRRVLESGATGFGLALLPASRAPAASAAVTLTAERRVLEVNGKPANVFGLTQPNGTRGLVTSVAEPFRVHLVNDAGLETLIHWHGLTPPYQQDGVPGVSGPPIPPGGTAEYDFALARPGTYWMHSHQGMQEQVLMTAPLIIHEATPASEREIVVLLHDFSFTSPKEIFARLRSRSSGDKAPMAGMSMTAPPDLNDVAYDAFLANDRTLADPFVVRVTPGERVRLRIINGASASNFHIELGALRATLLAVDGHPANKLTGSSFPLVIAQRIDLLVELPKQTGVWPVFGVVEGLAQRTGIVLATQGARVTRLAAQADRPSAPVNLGFEERLRGASPLAPRRADRVLPVALTGDMAAYIWTLNDKVYGQDTPLTVAKGERVELVMANRTMMSHPMHLHGHVFQVVEIDGRRFPGAMRDTVLVPPKTTVTVAFDADNPGKWAFHCHNLYHLEAGMMTTVRYVGI